MNPSYENRRRYEDGSVLCRIRTDQDGAIDDLAQMVKDGDENEYDGTLVVHRDRLGNVERVEVIDLLPAAKEWNAEGREHPIRSVHHRQSWRAHA